MASILVGPTQAIQESLEIRLVLEGFETRSAGLEDVALVSSWVPLSCDSSGVLEDKPVISAAEAEPVGRDGKSGAAPVRNCTQISALEYVSGGRVGCKH